MIYALKYFEIFVYDSVLELWGLLIWRRQVWEDQRHNLPQNYLAFHNIPASSSNKNFQRRKQNSSQNIMIVCDCMLYAWSLWPSLSLSWAVDLGGWMLMWFTVVQVATQLGGDSFIWVHHPRIILPMYSPSQLLTYPGLMYESPHILLMYCWYMLLRQLCVIYAGITIDARTGHTLVGLH